MTIKQLFPNLDNNHRQLIGRRFISSFIALTRTRPPKIQEDGLDVYDYPPDFIEKRLPKIKARYQKVFPKEDLRQPERPKRKRKIVTAERVYKK